MIAPPAERLRAAPGNEDDDVASDTTVEETYEEDMLWTVEDVLAEIPAEAGHRPRHFLIQWTGFELYDSTWEPEEHLELATIKSWEEIKDAIERGEAEKFDVADWWNARTKHLRGRLDRARRRDTKKHRRGRPLTGNAAVLEEQLRDHLLMEAEYYGIEVSELPAEDSDSDTNETVLPPPKTVDLTTSPPPSQEPSRSPTNGSSQQRKSAPVQRDTVSPTMRGGKGPMPTGPPSTGTSTSTEQRPKQPLRQRSGGKGEVPSSTTSSTTPGVLRPSRQTQPTGSRGYILKAKRTGAAAATQGAGANIFTSGKAARKRRDLVETMKDPTKENKFFHKHRIARIAHKKSRDKEDLPPAAVSSKLFDISKGPENDRPKETGIIQTTLNRQEIPSALVKRRTADDGSKGAESGPPPLPEKKRKKSVRFCDTTIERSPPPRVCSSPQSEPMDLDEQIDEPSLFVPGGPPSPTEVKPEGDMHPSLTHLSIEDNFQFDQSLTATKILDFGSGGARKHRVLLDGIPNAPGEPWFSDLMESEEISFTHTCVARNLAFQLENIVGAKIGSGHIRSGAASDALENVATRLKLGSFGAVSFRDGYIIVAYPKRCNDWKTGVFDAGATSPVEVDLGYMLFTTGSDGNPPPGQAQPLESPGGDSIGGRGMVWQRILGFDYKALLPKAWAQGGNPENGRHAFFLLFPPSREADLNALCLYLQSCDRQCLIYTSREEGSWEHVLTGTGCCTIIIHEAATWALRRLKNVHRLMPVSDSRATFWRVTEAMTAHSGIPLGESERWTPPGKIGFHRLLPSGKAILLTPSFLLTQPCRAAQFLVWYWDNIARSRHTRTNKIVVAHDVCDYLRSIADQKWRERKSSAVFTSDEKQTDEVYGMLRDNCEASETAWMVMRDLSEASRRGSSLRDEDLAPIVYAPDGLAPTDEQSLVNWFGWWSTMNLDVYRCFIVLGTDEVDMRDGAGATVVTSLPTYHPDSTNDPDGCTHGGGQATANYGEITVPCQRLSNDHPGSMTSFLDGLNEGYNNALVILYKFPIGFSCHESRTTAPNYYPRLESFQSWFGYLRPFSSGEKKLTNRKFVYGGLFYTAVDDLNDRQEGRSHCHPWLAFYRPARPHVFARGKFNGKYELIIWDWTVPSNSPGGDVPEEKLFVAQRELIEFINQNTAAKNLGSKLESVWLGGPKSATPDEHPMDITLGFLEYLMEDTRIALPATEAQLRDHGYRKVIPHSQAQPVSPTNAGMEENVVYSDIFHPPRGNGTAQPSRCKNLFFEQAHEALGNNRMGRDRTFSYKFEPTMRWYEQQKKEGRGFEHMLVGRWKAAFDILLIGKEGKSGGSSGSPNGLTWREGLWKNVVHSTVSPATGKD